VLHLEAIEAIWRMKPDSRITSTATYALIKKSEVVFRLTEVSPQL
jgi:hypothetical protein